MILPFTPDELQQAVAVVVDGVTYLETPEKAAELVASGQGSYEKHPAEALKTD